ISTALTRLELWRVLLLGFAFFGTAPAGIASIRLLACIGCAPASVAELVGVAFLKRFPGVVWEGFEDFPLVYIALDHRPELLQRILFPEVAFALMRGIFGHGGTIAPVDGDGFGVTSDFGQMDVSSECFKQTAAFLTWHIAPTS